LAYRRGKRGLEVLLVHPGGPYWRNKDDGAWSMPKGEIGTSEDPEQTARCEFGEELGPAASIGPLQALGEIHQRGGKRVIAWRQRFDDRRVLGEYLADLMADGLVDLEARLHEDDVGTLPFRSDRRHRLADPELPGLVVGRP
jgi:ADP-ribose pyrophosphatase YjhB (NUDIX family)